MFMTWFFDGSIFDAIVSGNVAYELVRPLDLYNMWFVKNAATRLAKAVLRCVPILVVVFFLPQPFGMKLPPDFLSFAAFCLTMVLGLVVVLGFGMIIYITTFYTMSSNGIRYIAVSIADLLTGGLIPLPFLPDGLRQAVELLPFASMQNVPLLAYSGSLSGGELLFKIGLQLFWAIALIWLGKAMMKHALKKVVVQGG